MKKSANHMAVLVIVVLMSISYIVSFSYASDEREQLSSSSTVHTEQSTYPEKDLSLKELVILEHYFFTGLIGDKYPIQVELTRKGGTLINQDRCKPPYRPNSCPLEGHYFYLKPGTAGEHILLSGTIDDQGNFQIYEMTLNSNITGKFSGRFEPDRTGRQRDLE
ncbi:MAG: hypothetical protein SNJ53_08225 [Thermodesulfovibrionales bacterium]